ncbi:MAG: hypothetical protein M3Y85_08000, partial [Bacteroidota bacterium]|nr:hypothetical protein [Bacteroidota bacterium]
MPKTLSTPEGLFALHIVLFPFLKNYISFELLSQISQFSIHHSQFQKMLSQKISKTFSLGDGREITIETGRLARQADGSVTV